jgi:tetratricopeptide (TPR) repeat protein
MAETACGARAPDPPAEEAARDRGLLALSRGRPDEAALLLIRACEADPRDAEALAALASAFSALGLRTKAAAALLRAARLRPADPGAAVAAAAGLKAAGDLAGAEAQARRAVALAPGGAGPLCALAEILSAAGRHGEAAAAVADGRRRGVDSVPLRNVLVMALHAAGRADAAVREGEALLAMKDAEASARFAAVGGGLALRRPEPRPGGRDVLSFSLFGDAPIYVEGAIANARLAAVHYPGWTCRFYLGDGVPSGAVDALRALGAEVAAPPPRLRPLHGAIWRFAVSDDPGVRLFACRDADSRIGPREAAAVRAWAASGRAFHVMRDHPCHAELVLAGMWGGVAGALPPMDELLDRFGEASAAGRWSDQAFAAAAAWPLMRGEALIHDRHWRLFGAVPFPDGAPADPADHVGRAVAPGGVTG